MSKLLPGRPILYEITRSRRVSFHHRRTDAQSGERKCRNADAHNQKLRDYPKPLPERRALRLPAGFLSAHNVVHRGTG
jgi:hypothetical protein